MKKITLALIAFIITASVAQAQCFRDGTFVAIDNPDDYPVAGTASLRFETDGTKQVIFADDFATVQGIELRVFLTTTERLDQGGTELEVSTEPLQDDNGGQDMGDPITGMKIFDVPNNVNLGDFSYIIIQCVQADVLWGRIELSDNQGPDCATLTINDRPFENVEIMPNPIKDQFSITGLTTENNNIVIYDVVGKQVHTQQNITNQTIYVPSLKTGLYIMTISLGDQKTTRKLIIQ